MIDQCRSAGLGLEFGLEDKRTVDVATARASAQPWSVATVPSIGCAGLASIRRRALPLWWERPRMAGG